MYLEVNSIQIILKVAKLDATSKMCILEGLLGPPQLIFDSQGQNPGVHVFQILFSIEFLIFFSLGLYLALIKYLENYTKVSAIKQPLGLIHSLFLKHQETLIKVTSMNLSYKTEKSQGLLLPQDVTYRKANPGLHSILLNPVSTGD